MTKPKSEPKALKGELIPKKPRAKRNAKYELSLATTIKFTPELIAEIKKHYSKGATLRQIAYAFGIHPETLASKIRENAALCKALHEGRLKIVHDLAGKAYEEAMKGDRILLMFLLKTMGQFRENKEPDDVGTDGQVTAPVLKLACTDPIEAMQAYERVMRDS